MDEQTPGLGAIVSRLERVERENRRLRQAGLVALLVAVAVVLMGQGRPRRTVEAERFVLKDESGKVRAELFMETPYGPALYYRDERGYPVAALKGGALFVRLCPG
jgi:hypothetical protein